MDYDKNIFFNVLHFYLAIPSISDVQSDRKSVSSELHKIMLTKVQKGYKCLIKSIKLAFPVKMHIYTLSFITTKYPRKGLITRTSKALAPTVQKL